MKISVVLASPAFRSLYVSFFFDHKLFFKKGVAKMSRHQMEMHEIYITQREKGNSWTAQSWQDIVWEAERAIGAEDAKLWLDSMADILADPYFVKTPILAEFVAPKKMLHQFPHCVGHTWCSPHPYANEKLGVYQVWRPNGTDKLFMEEVQGEDAVRIALAENKLKTMM